MYEYVLYSIYTIMYMAETLNRQIKRAYAQINKKRKITQNIRIY